MILTSVDLKLFLVHYNVSYIEYVSGYKFKASTNIFKKYIDFWMHIKETHTGAIRQLAKLMLNSLYGKFATSPRSVLKEPYLEEGLVKYKNLEPTMRDSVYTAVGCFVTANGRYKTITTAQAMFDRFMYADTDSLHLYGYEEPIIDIHPTSLGAWKSEGIFVDGVFLRAKTYYEVKQGKTIHTAYGLNDCFIAEKNVVCAGMPANIKPNVTLDNYGYGASYAGKLLPKRVKGGVVLKETDFTIKRLKEYEVM